MTQEPAGSYPPKGLSERSCRLLAGLDTGLAGAIVLVGWFLFHSWLTGEFWWAKLNVAGALFYGSSVYTMGFSRASLAGASLLLVLYTALGGLFGLIARPSGFTRNLLLGMLLAMTWHLLSQRYFWRRLDSFGPAYFPVLSTLPAHLIFGLSLSRFSSRFQRLALAFGDSEWVEDLLRNLHQEEAQPPAEPSPVFGPAGSSEVTDVAGPVEYTHETPEVSTIGPPEPVDAALRASTAPVAGEPAADPGTPLEASQQTASEAPPDQTKPPAGEESSPSVKSDC
ncbi:hypothetical protein [Paludibaculum fermentans]|uniref:Uncharacterized protein n=1 Tax=Paludibaculum fermentans TaxID=1473598 RepID=A0A7S7NQC1_PALFE|nr:hypothetical protein [Paludibaculum fermentans]QOY87843.1 hypothetical protein IRI77_34750 [Paludibaculum fermentans]